MARYLKTLGLLTAAMAICSLGASAAQAEGLFKSEKYPTTGTSLGEEEWHFKGGTIKCASTHKQHETAEATTAIQTTPTYAQCSGLGFVQATVTMNTCSFGLNAGVEQAKDVFSGSMDIGCPAGKTIVFVASTCEIQIDAQATVKKTKFTSKTEAAPKKSIEVELALESVRYDITKDGFLCPLPGVEKREDGKVTSVVTTTGKDAEGNAVGIWVE